MKHRVTANLIIPKLPPNNSVNFLGIELFEDSNFKSDPVPSIRNITAGKKCEMMYTDVSDIKINSPYFMRVEVETEEASKIEELARRVFDSFINNLSFMAGEFWGEYIIVKIETLVDNEWKTIYSIYSSPAKLSISINPSTLGEKELEQLKKLINVNDEIYKKSLDYLSKGERKLNRDLNRGEGRVDQDAFLNLFKPIELISNELADKQEKEIPENWKDEFIKMWDEGEKRKAVENIIKNYRKLSLQNLADKIKDTAGKLKLSEQEIKKAVDFSSFRSNYDIAHAHKSFNDNRIDYNELSKLARLFLRKYLEYKNLI